MRPADIVRRRARSRMRGHGGSSMKLQSIDPTTGELIESFDEISDADLEAALERARQTWHRYRRTSFAERAGWLRNAAQILEAESDQWARLMTLEMGKTYKAAVAEAQKCAWACRYFAENGERFLADERVKAVTLTGSDLAGSQVAEQAGKHIKKTVMELGGSDPFIVLPSADLAAAVRTAVTARNINNGQSCIAAKRFIIHRKIYDQFLPAFVAAIK